ncbi:MAG: hypothetical protein WBF73_15420, partial [Bradyrhizobium sp.]
MQHKAMHEIFRKGQRNDTTGEKLALSASLVEELRAHRLRQAEELLKVGVRLSDNTFVVAQADGT